MESTSKNNKKKTSIPLVVGAAGLALGVGAAAAAAVTYKKNKKFKKSVDGFIDDAKEQSLNYAEQLKDKLESMPQAKKLGILNKSTKSKPTKSAASKSKVSKNKKSTSKKK